MCTKNFNQLLAGIRNMPNCHIGSHITQHAPKVWISAAALLHIAERTTSRTLQFTLILRRFQLEQSWTSWTRFYYIASRRRSAIVAHIAQSQLHWSIHIDLGNVIYRLFLHGLCTVFVYTRYADTSFVMFVSWCIFVSFRTFLFFLRPPIVQCWFALIWIRSKTKSSTCTTRTTIADTQTSNRSFIASLSNTWIHDHMKKDRESI